MQDLLNSSWIYFIAASCLEMIALSVLWWCGVRPSHVTQAVEYAIARVIEAWHRVVG